MRYAGADWIESAIKVECSPLGKAVADLLGELFAGIYHLRRASLRRVQWSDPYRISVTVGEDLSTYDSNLLTKLVFLAHHCCLRVTVEPASPSYLRLVFWRRKRSSADTSHRHPTLDEAVAQFGQYCSLPEYVERIDEEAVKGAPETDDAAGVSA